MRSLKYLFRKFIQWAAGVFYEGPEAPPRLATAVDAFQFTHPVASRDQWAAFALEMAEEAYRAGYQRGYEQRVQDVSELAAAGVVVPMTSHGVVPEQATPHQLESHEHIAETVELRAQAGKVVKMSLAEALKPDPELAKREADYWRDNAGVGPRQQR